MKILNLKLMSTLRVKEALLFLALDDLLGLSLNGFQSYTSYRIRNKTESLYER